MVDTDRPPRLGVLLAGGAATVTALALVVVPMASLLAVGGVAAVAFGTSRGSRGLVGVGALVQFASVIFAGTVSNAPGLLLIGMVGAVLGWDVGEQSINVTQQLGTDATVRRPIVVHAALSTFVGAITIGVVYATFFVTTGGQQLIVLALFLGGGALVLLAMRA